MAMKPRKMMRGGAAKKMMGKPGGKGAPTNKAFRESAKTAKK